MQPGKNSTWTSKNHLFFEATNIFPDLVASLSQSSTTDFNIFSNWDFPANIYLFEVTIESLEKGAKYVQS